MVKKGCENTTDLNHPMDSFRSILKKKTLYNSCITDLQGLYSYKF